MKILTDKFKHKTVNSWAALYRRSHRSVCSCVWRDRDSNPDRRG